MNKSELVAQYNAGKISGKISKQGLGNLRKIILGEVLNELTSDDLPIKEARKMLDSKLSKIDYNVLASKIGYDCKAVNLRQSFKLDIKEAENKLREKGIIVEDKKSRSEQKDDNIAGFLEFIQARLNDSAYEWPKNLKGGLYRRAIWAFYTNTPLEDIKYAGSILSQDNIIRKTLADIDVKIANNEVKALDFSSLSAIDDMSNTMESKVIAQLRKDLAVAQKRLVEEREARLTLEQNLAEIRRAQKRLLRGDTTALKGIH